MLTSYDSLLVKNRYLTGAVVKEEMLRVKEAVSNVMTQKGNKMNLQKLCKKNFELIKSAIFIFENLLVHEFYPVWTTIIWKN